MIVKDFVSSYILIDIIVIIYILFGLTHIMLDIEFPYWFYGLTLFLGFKWMFNYRKCTFSYIEVKLRNVKKEEGYLYSFLEALVNFRNTQYIYAIFILQAIFILYYGKKNNYQYHLK